MDAEDYVVNPVEETKVTG